MGEVSQKKEETATKPEGEKKPVNVTVMKLDMHCEGCGKKIKRLLKHYKGIIIIIKLSSSPRITSQVRNPNASSLILLRR